MVIPPCLTPLDIEKKQNRNTSPPFNADSLFTVPKYSVLNTLNQGCLI